MTNLDRICKSLSRIEAIKASVSSPSAGWLPAGFAVAWIVHIFLSISNKLPESMLNWALLMLCVTLGISFIPWLVIKIAVNKLHRILVAKHDEAKTQYLAERQRQDETRWAREAELAKQQDEVRREVEAVRKKGKADLCARQAEIKKRLEIVEHDILPIIRKSGADDPDEIIKLHDTGYYKWDPQGQCWCVDEALLSNEKRLRKLEKEFGINIDW